MHMDYCLDKATARRNTILKLMVTHGYITQQEYEEAKATKIENTLCASPTTNNNPSKTANKPIISPHI